MWHLFANDGQQTVSDVVTALLCLLNGVLLLMMRRDTTLTKPDAGRLARCSLSYLLYQFQTCDMITLHGIPVFLYGDGRF